MAIKKTVSIDGIEVTLKASAAVPLLYRTKFRRDIFIDFAKIQKAIQGEDVEEKEDASIDAMEVIEKIAYVMAKHADPQGVPDSIEDWLDQFSMLGIYSIMTEIFELWGANIETKSTSKKNIALPHAQ